ncbi:MAG: hypothetical protein AABX89_01565 [Candidatus Thermoplasmatota archaeon]
MAHNHDHAPVLAASNKLLQNLFATSEQAMYVYVDDANKACNELFAELLGYASPAAWAAVKTPFPSTFVAKESQDDLIGTYQDAMEHGAGGVTAIIWKRKDGKTVETDVILVPLEIEGHRVALHFVQPVDDEE